jgi:rSAM/selenodomain-associated transferase 1
MGEPSPGRRCLIVVAKPPLAGAAKTRLAAGIGAERAAELYRCFLDDTVALAGRLPACRLALSFWPPSAAGFFRELHPGAELLPQQGERFGDRLLSAFVQARALGYEELVLIGSDNPGLPAAYVERAFAALAHAPAVMGPAEDGGWYLMGLLAPQPALFHAGIAWSTPAVAAQTRASAAAAGLALAEAPPWYDIDTAADLPGLLADLRSGREGAWAPATLARLEALAEDGLAELLAAHAVAAE